MARGDQVNKSALAGVINSYLDAGLSATAGLRQFRETGLGVRTQLWYRTYGEIAAARSQRPAINAHPGQDPFAPHMFTEWQSSAPPGRYYHLLNVYTLEQDTGTVFSTPFTVVGSDPLSANAAIDDALSTLSDFDASSLDSGGNTILGATVSGLYVSTGAP